MGERMSARLFAAALRSLGAKARWIDPGCAEWPVITNSNFGRAEVNLTKTQRRFRKYVVPLLERRVVPVLCGFLGRDEDGNVTTIGRGGSDVTAFLVGKYVGADEVIIVTDAEGVMSADPRMIDGAQLLKQIAVEEMRDLARYGARVLHPRALDYKDPGINAKVIHFRHGNLSARGTIIVGPKGGEVRTTLYEKPLAMLTIVGEKLQLVPGILVKTVGPLSKAGINVFGVSIGPRTFSIYVGQEEMQRSLKLLHDAVAKHELMKSVTSEGEIALIIAESKKFIGTPGMIAKLSQPLAEEGINIIEILSSRASISFFVSWADRKRALKLVKRTMKEIGG
jgi:aspartate kinase